MGVSEGENGGNSTDWKEGEVKEEREEDKGDQGDEAGGRQGMEGKEREGAVEGYGNMVRRAWQERHALADGLATYLGVGLFAQVVRL